MHIPSVSVVPPSKSFPIIHGSMGYLSTLSKVKCFAAVCFTTLVILLYKYFKTSNSTSFSSRTPISPPVLLEVWEENPVTQHDTTEEITVPKASYQNLDLLLDIVKSLEDLIASGKDDNKTKQDKLENVQILCDNWPLFKQMLKTVKKIGPNGLIPTSNPSETFLDAPIETVKNILTTTKTSIEKAKNCI